jgi:hypothetical protein
MVEQLDHISLVERQHCAIEFCVLREMGWEGMDLGASGGLLWTWQCMFKFHKKWRNSWLVEWLLASQEGLSSMEFCLLVTQISQSVSGMKILPVVHLISICNYLDNFGLCVLSFVV